MTERRIYPRPPIVEAVVEIQFASKIKREELIEILQREIATDYAGKKKHKDKVEVSASVNETTTSSSVSKQRDVTFLRSEDGLRLIGCRDHGMSVHVLAPYPGWENFVEQVQQAVGALPTDVTSAGAKLLSVRYIDRLDLPKASPHDYVTVVPTFPSSLPQPAQAFHIAIRTKAEEDGCEAVLTLAGAEGQTEGGMMVIYDLVTLRHGSPVFRLDDEEWLEVIERLHERERDIFEESITDDAREMFQ